MQLPAWREIRTSMSKRLGLFEAAPPPERQTRKSESSCALNLGAVAPWQSEPRPVCGTCGEYVGDGPMDCHDPVDCREIWDTYRATHEKGPISKSLIVMHEPATSMVYGLEKDAQQRYYQQQIEHGRSLRYEGEILRARSTLTFWRLSCGVLLVVILYLVTHR